MKLEFGSKIVVTGRYWRMTSYVNKMTGKQLRNNEFWNYWDQLHTGPTECIFLGERTLRNGIKEYIGDEATVFHVKEVIRVALVCPGPRHNPFYAPLESVTPLWRDEEQNEG